MSCPSKSGTWKYSKHQSDKTFCDLCDISSNNELVLFDSLIKIKFVI